MLVTNTRNGQDTGKEIQVKELNGANLKSILWDALQELRDGKLKKKEAESVASLAREIIKATNIQVKILDLSRRGMTDELVIFADGIRAANG